MITPRSHNLTWIERSFASVSSQRRAKRRVTMLLDTGLVEYFKAQAGERGYQTLINETLRQAVERDELEVRLRRIIREELQREAVLAGA
jgi:uncharacterized protein (DUF4415 family)